MKIKKIILLSLILGTALNGCNQGGSSNKHTTSLDDVSILFESEEHFLIAADLLLTMPEGSAIKQYRGDQLIVKKPGYGAHLTFADMVWLSGDFIGEPNVVIGASTSNEENQQKFMQNFSGYEKYATYLPKVMEIFYKQLEDVQGDISKAQRLQINQKANSDFACATGGGCNPVSLLFSPGLYGNMAIGNYDHFGKTAQRAYIAGHTLALKKASSATSEADLLEAYALDGYAAHFLTDLYASGHTRVPRAELVDYCAYSPKVVSGVLAHDMHEDDGNNGIWLTNKNGDHWFAYGDKNYFIPENQDNFKHVKATLQQSLDQVYLAYKNHSSDQEIADLTTQMVDLIPDVELTLADGKNQPALYKVDTDGKTILQFDKSTKQYAPLGNCVYAAKGGIYEFMREFFGA